MKFAGYTRHSNEDQIDSEGTQTDIINDYCKRNGHEVVLWYHEGACSGSVPIENRAVCRELFTQVQSKKRIFDAVIVMRKDRLFRDLLDELSAMQTLEKCKCPLYTIDGIVDRSSPENEFLSNVIGAAAQFERKLTGARIKQHNLARAMQGKLPSGVMPLGLKYDKQTQTYLATEQAKDILKIYELYIETNGNLSETTIIAAQIGIRSQRGSIINMSAMHKLLRSLAYRQKLFYAGRVFEAPGIPQIIPVELIEQVDAINDNNKQYTPRQLHNKLAYSAKLTCGICGRTMHSNQCRNSKYSSKKYYGWQCPNRELKLCESSKISERWIDNMLSQALHNLLMRLSGSITFKEDEPVKMQKKDHKQTSLKKQRERWLKLYTEGLIEWDAMSANLKQLEEQINKVSEVPKMVNITADKAREWLSMIKDNWSKMEQADKRSLLDELGARITLWSPRTGKRKLELITSTKCLPIVVKMDCSVNRKNTR